MYRLGGYRERPVPPSLAPLAGCLWTYARPVGARALPGRGHRVLPDPEVSLAFWSVRNARGAVVDGSLRVLGPVRTPRFFHPAEGLHLAAIRLKAEWCRPLLGRDPGEIPGAIAELDGGWRGYRDRLCRTASSAEALVVLCGLLEDRARTTRAGRAESVAHAGLEHLRRLRGPSLRMDRPCRDLRVSERHLRRAVVEAVGTGPKAFHRAIRLVRAVAAADQDPAAPWTRVALGAGFYDQAHLVRECRALAGATPTELRAERAAQQRRAR